MKNRLIFLGGVVLLLLIVVIGYYFYQKNQISPIKNDIPADMTATDDNQKTKPEENSQLGSELEKIQEHFLDDTDTIQIIEEEKEKSPEETARLQQINSAMGKIVSKDSGSIQVEFSRQEVVWKSKVLIGEITSIHLPSKSFDSMGEEIKIGDLSVGDQVIVNAEGNIINNDSFVALSIHKIN